jgi:hypothetical protein
VSERQQGQQDPWAVFERLVVQEPVSWQDWEKRLVAFGGLRRELNNGGFDQYSFNSAGDQAFDAVAAAEAAGESDVAGLVRRAVRALDVEDLEDRAARQNALDSLDDEDAFTALDEEFHALEASRDLDSAMRSLLP